MRGVVNKACGIGLGVATALAFTASSAGAGSWEDRFGVPAYQYAVKFVCGFLSAPVDGIVPLTVGDYATAINVVNANDQSVTNVIRYVPTEIVAGDLLVTEEFGSISSFSGLGRDCGDIIDTDGDPVEVFIEGFAIVQSCRHPLDVTAVYQVSRGNQTGADHSISQSVEQIQGRKIRLPSQTCNPT